MTPKILADALSCFWNAALGAAHVRQSSNAMEVASVIAEGVAAVAARLEKHDAGESRRVSELLEANNRYQQEARDGRADTSRLTEALGAITDLSTNLRQGGPAPEDLQGLSSALEEAINLASEALLAGKTEDTTPPEEAPIPEAPWPATARDNNNAKREGWKAFWTGRARGDCPFPPASPELWRAFGVGWDAAEAQQSGTAG